MNPRKGATALLIPEFLSYVYIAVALGQNFKNSEVNIHKRLNQIWTSQNDMVGEAFYSKVGVQLCSFIVTILTTIWFFSFLSVQLVKQNGLSRKFPLMVTSKNYDSMYNHFSNLKKATAFAGN